MHPLSERVWHSWERETYGTVAFAQAQDPANGTGRLREACESMGSHYGVRARHGMATEVLVAWSKGHEGQVLLEQFESDVEV